MFFLEWATWYLQKLKWEATTELTLGEKKESSVGHFLFTGARWCILLLR